MAASAGLRRIRSDGGLSWGSGGLFGDAYNDLSVQECAQTCSGVSGARGFQVGVGSRAGLCICAQGLTQMGVANPVFNVYELVELVTPWYAVGTSTEAAPSSSSGWTVILKTNGDDTFQYDSSYWTSTANVLNEDSDPYAPGNAKYSEYNTMRFTEVRACVDTLDNCLDGHTFAEPYANAAQLFGGGHQREGIDQAEFESVFGVSGNQNCGMQRPGFNTQCRGGNWARWGFCNNLPNQGCQTNDNNDADGVIGFGVTGQDCCPLGAGWTVR